MYMILHTMTYTVYNIYITDTQHPVYYILYLISF